MKNIIILSFSLLLACCNGNMQKDPDKKDTINTHLPTEPFPSDNQYKDSVKRPVSDSGVKVDSMSSHR